MDYLGKAALGRIKEEGVKRKLSGSRSRVRRSEPGSRLLGCPCGRPEVGHSLVDVFAGSKRISAMPPGSITRRSARGCGIYDEGTRGATVVKKPFVDPKKDIPKS